MTSKKGRRFSETPALFILTTTSFLVDDTRALQVSVVL